MSLFNKLVRDKVPKIIEESGRSCTFRKLSTEDYQNELRKKGLEELNEYFSSKSDEEAIEELADVLEVLIALGATHGATFEEMNQVRKVKREKNGGFDNKFFLVEVL